jgi:hypothetical protein
LSYRAVKVARGVLRGLGASDGPWLPDVRHEVVQVAVVTAVSIELTAIRQDATRSSATGILPGRASLVTAGCEAPGTSVSLIPPSSIQPVERQG